MAALQPLERGFVAGVVGRRACPAEVPRSHPHLQSQANIPIHTTLPSTFGRAVGGRRTVFMIVNCSIRRSPNRRRMPPPVQTVCQSLRAIECAPQSRDIGARSDDIDARSASIEHRSRDIRARSANACDRSADVVARSRVPSARSRHVRDRSDDPCARSADIAYRSMNT